MTADGASSSLRVDPLDCDPRIVELIDAFYHAMRVERNASVHTLRAYRIDLMDFARWASASTSSLPRIASCAVTWASSTADSARAPR